MATKPTLESLSSLHLMLRSPPRVENNGGYENMAYFIFCMFVIKCNMFMLHHILSYLIRFNSSELLQLAYLLFFITKMYENRAVSVSSATHINCCNNCCASGLRS